jgi:hypothetical protein
MSKTSYICEWREYFFFRTKLGVSGGDKVLLACLLMKWLTCTLCCSGIYFVSCTCGRMLFTLLVCALLFGAWVKPNREVVFFFNFFCFSTSPNIVDNLMQLDSAHAYRKFWTVKTKWNNVSSLVLPSIFLTQCCCCCDHRWWAAYASWWNEFNTRLTLRLLYPWYLCMRMWNQSIRHHAQRRVSGSATWSIWLENGMTFRDNITPIYWMIHCKLGTVTFAQCAVRTNGVLSWETWTSDKGQGTSHFQLLQCVEVSGKMSDGRKNGESENVESWTIT